jgi:MFS family permease
MFTTAVFFNFLGPLILGVILDSFGPRVCSLVSLICVFIGFVLFSFSNLETFPMFIPALCFIAFGGPGAQSSIIHLSNLFPTWKATATACITGSFQLSFIVFLVFDLLWLKYGFTYRSLFLGYSSLCLINILISLFLWPDIPYNYDEQMEFHEQEMKEEKQKQQQLQQHSQPAELQGINNQIEEVKGPVGEEEEEDDTSQVS